MHAVLASLNELEFSGDEAETPPHHALLQDLDALELDSDSNAALLADLGALSVPGDADSMDDDSDLGHDADALVVEQAIVAIDAGALDVVPLADVDLAASVASLVSMDICAGAVAMPAAWILKLSRQGLCSPDELLSDVSLKVSSYLLNDKQHLLNGAAESTNLGVNRKEWRTVRRVTAAAVWNYERQNWRKAEELIVALPDVRLIAYFDFCSYDGVDLRVGLKAFKKQVVSAFPSVQPEGEQFPAGTHEMQLASDIINKRDSSALSGWSHVLQADSSVGMVIFVRGRYHFIRAHMLPVLLGMDTIAADTLLAAFSRIDPGSIWRNSFPRRVRLCRDRDRE